MRRLETYHIVYSFLFSPYFDNLPGDVQRSFLKPGVLAKLLSVFKTIAHEVRQLLNSKKAVQPTAGKMWIIVDAINNLQSVEFILSKNSDIEPVTTSYSLARTQPQVKYLPSSLRSRYMFLMLWFVLKNRKRVGKRWDLFMRESGWYEMALEQLASFKPRSILFTNDHTPGNRAKMLAAKKLGIKTGYIQHACVRKDFGELLIDNAFLDGQDSVDKYALHTVNFKSDIFLIGMPRLAPFLALRKVKGPVVSVGIAYNTTDGLREIEALIASLSQYRVIVRPHPKDNRRPNSALDFVLSDPATENVALFLKNVDAVIAGESSIHLEAILLNRPSFLYELNGQSQIIDLYGFEKSGLIKRFKNPEALLEEIQRYNKDPYDVFMNAAYYNSMTGNVDESISDSVAYELIRSKLLG